MNEITDDIDWVWRLQQGWEAAGQTECLDCFSTSFPPPLSQLLCIDSYLTNLTHFSPLQTLVFATGSYSAEYAGFWIGERHNLLTMEEGMWWWIGSAQPPAAAVGRENVGEGGFPWVENLAQRHTGRHLARLERRQLGWVDPSCAQRRHFFSIRKREGDGERDVTRVSHSNHRICVVSSLAAYQQSREALLTFACNSRTVSGQGRI